MKHTAFILTICLAVASPLGVADESVSNSEYPDAMGVEIDQDAAWYKECMRVKDIQPPAGEKPTAQLIATLVDCSAEDLYYDAKVDSMASDETWRKVRACAFSEDDNTVLMMLYANGFGVKVNPDLAIKYSCSGPRDEEEIALQVADLIALKTSARGRGRVIDQCDYAGNTPAIERCQDLAERQRTRMRNRSLDEISRKMSAQQKQVFDKLRKAAAQFADAHGSEEYEANISGTMRGQIAIGTTSKENQQFLGDVEQCENGVFPTYTQAQFAELDKHLNQTYRRIMRSNNVQARQAGVYDVVSTTTVKETQRLWLKYRDAWVEFGRARYPSVPAHAWEALLTERRIKQLKEPSNNEQQE